MSYWTKMNQETMRLLDEPNDKTGPLPTKLVDNCVDHILISFVFPQFRSFILSRDFFLLAIKRVEIKDGDRQSGNCYRQIIFIPHSSIKILSSHIPPPFFSPAKRMLDPLFMSYVCGFNKFFLVHQVPLLIPILVLLASIYLIVAPFYEAPLESFFCLLFILAGIPFYLVFVHFNIVPQSFFDAIGKFRFRFNVLNLLTSKSSRCLTISVHS